MIGFIEFDEIPRPQRSFYSVILAAASMAVFYVAWLMGNLAWAEYERDQRFAVEGVQAPGVISGFKYNNGGKTKRPERIAGYYADVSFSTPSGTVTVPGGKRYIHEREAKLMLGWPVNVVYLPGEPRQTRVADWQQSSLPEWVASTLFFAVLAVWLLYFGYRMWPGEPEY